MDLIMNARRDGFDNECEGKQENKTVELKLAFSVALLPRS